MFPNARILRRGLLLAAVCALALGLSLSAHLPARAAYPGTNGLIAFVTDRDGNFEIYVMNDDGTGQTNLTQNPAADQAPTWSPDGTQIAFTSDRDGDFDIYVMNADGTDQTQITNSPGLDTNPTWSPDGARIAFWTNRTGNDDIFVMNADGSSPVNISNRTSTDYFPAWSPDGTKIAFSSTRTGNDEIFVMNPDGSSQAQVTFNPQWEYDPNWSPDGTKIAFIGSPYGNHELYVMNADGSGLINMSNTPAAEQGPAWSPDGTKLAFMSMRDGERDVWVMPAAGGTAVNLSDNPAQDIDPDWQPVQPVEDETAIYVSMSGPGQLPGGEPYGPDDVLLWDGEEWSIWFDGSDAGLMPTGKWKHDISAMYIPDDPEGDLIVAFAQNRRPVPGVPGKVNGMDLVRWDGSAWSMWFDGQDVGLTLLTPEKIDALHVLPGDMSPVGGDCVAYLLISTQGPGQVPAPAGPPIKFSGEDVLGFCMVNAGATTTGYWHKALDGSDVGLPRNSLTGLSTSADGQTLYLTTRGLFNHDGVMGGHSMVFVYDRNSGEFSGPIFRIVDVGLSGKVDALHVASAPERR